MRKADARLVSLAAVSALSKKVFPRQFFLAITLVLFMILVEMNFYLRNVVKSVLSAGCVTLLLNRKTDQCTTH